MAVSTEERRQAIRDVLDMMARGAPVLRDLRRTLPWWGHDPIFRLRCWLWWKLHVCIVRFYIRHACERDPDPTFYDLAEAELDRIIAVRNGMP